MRYTTTTLLLAAGLTLAGCGASHDEAKSSNTKPSPTVSKEGQFLKAARQITFNGTPSDEALLAFPPKWCDDLDAGHSVEWIFGLRGGNLYPVGEDWGTVKQDADALLVAGVKAYCPRNAKSVAGELRASGGY